MRLLLAVVASLVFPGAGHGLVEGRRGRMAVFAVANLVATAAIVVSVWSIVGMLAVRVIAAADAAWCARRGVADRWMPALVAVVFGIVGVVWVQLGVETYAIPSESMVPTLEVGDRVLAEKIDKKLVRGEVVVFTQPCAKTTFVKRVVALGGDSVEVRCGVLYVNGNVVDRRAAGDASHDFPTREVLIPPSCVQGNFYDTPKSDQQPQGKIVDAGKAADACAPQLHFVVPPSSFFVMSDNRSTANDSRYWGVVPERALIGRVIGVYAPWSRFRSVR